MRAANRSRRVATVGVALVLAVGTALVGGIAGSATAGTVPPPVTGTPTVSYVPEGPFNDGDTVTVTVDHADPLAQVIINQCASGRHQTGPGDCGPSSKGASALVQADANGHAAATLTVVVGALGNQIAPSSTCDATHRCDWTAVLLTTGKVYDTVRIPFANSGPPSVGFLPEGPLRDGQKISVVADGFTPGATIAIAQCASDRPVLGPGDCGRSAAGALKLVEADGAGFARATLTFQYGHLGNATPPAIVCTPTHACIVDAINIEDVTQERKAPLAISSLQVTPRVSISLSKTKVKHGKKVTFTGAVAPYAADERVRLQRREHGVWKTKASQLLTRSSTYSLVWKPVSKTDFRWRVVLNKTPYHPAGTSATRVLKVT